LEKNLGISENTNACISMASGEYFGLLDHDDLLHPAALFEVMTAICQQDADMIYTDENTFRVTPADAYCPHFKPDFAPDTLRSLNYICHFLVFRRSLLEKVGVGFRPECNGSQDYDLVLRLSEQAQTIVHIPEILYYWRASANSTAADINAKPYIIQAAHQALAEHLERCGMDGAVEDSLVASMYRIKYAIAGTPLVSILIPNKDYIETLRVCVDSILEKTTYPNYELIIIENNSVEAETFAYYKTLEADVRIRVVTWEGGFNYPAINNLGAEHAKGEYFLLLNNDIEVITPDWIQELLMFAQRKDVGAVGAKLYYPDGRIQHAGVILGIGGVAGHAHKYFPHQDYGYMGRLIYAQNLSAVTGACMLIPRKVYEEVNGLDPAFAVAFNDVDLCMKIRQKGYQIVFTPFAEMIHHESLSRGLEDTPEKQERFRKEIDLFESRWGDKLVKGDPFYNPHFTLSHEDFSLR
jgi:GT2 family glycosyltransferase